MRQFFTTLKFIELEKSNEECLDLIPGIQICNSQNLKELILTNKNKEIIGKIEADFIRDCNAFLYYEYDDDFFKGQNNLEILESILLWIDDVFKNLWLVKDNCISVDTAFLIYDRDRIIIEASSQRLQYLFTKSTGKIEPTQFTKNELLEFAKYHDYIESHFYSKKSSSTDFMLNKNFSRINRGLIFVKQAREARNLAYKISNYCSALETLFSTDNIELSHKLSERIAFFLKDDYNKLETFRVIKKAYGIRSKLTHGDTLDDKQIETLGKISTEIDEILRFSINKIFKEIKLLEIFESPKNVIDSFFDEIIFEK